MLQNRAKPRYDRDELKKHAEDIATRYLGPGHNEGDSRMLWNCPACAKENKYSIRRRDQLAGCMNSGCELGGGADILTLIAYFEQLDVRNEFTEVLKRGYKVIGLDGVLERGKPPEGRTRPSQAPQQRPTSRTPEQHSQWVDLCHRVYERLMALCPLEDRDRKYLRGRSLTYETIEAGRFGSISAERARYLKKQLLEEFGKEGLLQVPGFFEDAKGRMSFTLTGNYLLIPYHDPAGNITTLEGRTCGEIPKNMGKYVSVRGSGNHLYLFPTVASELETIVAFTEGVFGAVVAAQSGLVVASIQGCKRYKASPSPLDPDYEEDHPLPELHGLDFAARTIPYIPDADDPPNHDVLDAAPKAAHHLIERQGGTATLCSLPLGMDLDEWLLNLPKQDRREKFLQLVSEATPLNEAEKWSQAQSNTSAPASDPAAEPPAASTAIERGTPPGATQRGGAEAKTTGSIHSHNDGTDHEAADPAAEAKQPEASQPAKKQTREDRELAAAVYTRLLEKSPPSDAHKAALARRGVLERAVEVGRLASLDPGKSARVTAELKEEFGAEDLIRVPGFERGHSGKISLGLPARGEYLLLPCFDARGTLRGVEALEYDPEIADLSDHEKTIQLDGAGAHLYVFAHHSPTEIEGFCEGPLGAILAAQQDVVLGAVGHFRRYSSKGETARRGGAETILPELAGVDFEGREIIYVPRSVSGEAKARAGEAEHACRHLIAKQNGEPNLIFPSDPFASPASTAPTSMAEWIPALPEEARQDKLKDLFPESPRRSIAADDERPETTQDDAPPADPGETTARPLTLPSTPALVLIALVGLAVTIVSYLLIARLQAFSEYVGVAFGRQPFIEGGPVGAMRRLSGSPPFDILYAHKFPLSLLPGLIALSGAFYIWHSCQRLADVAEDLQRFATGPWSAHRSDSGQHVEERLLGGFVSARDLLWSILVVLGAFVVLKAVLLLAERIYDASTAFGLASGSYSSLFAVSGTLALIVALATGVYVLLSRSGKHRGRARIAQGRIRS